MRGLVKLSREQHLPTAWRRGEFGRRAAHAPAPMLLSQLPKSQRASWGCRTVFDLKPQLGLPEGQLKKKLPPHSRWPPPIARVAPRHLGHLGGLRPIRQMARLPWATALTICGYSRGNSDSRVPPEYQSQVARASCRIVLSRSPRWAPLPLAHQDAVL